MVALVLCAACRAAAVEVNSALELLAELRQAMAEGRDEVFVLPSRISFAGVSFTMLNGTVVSTGNYTLAGASDGGTIFDTAMR